MQLPVQILFSPALLQATADAGPLGGTQGPDLTRYFLVCAVLIAATAGVTWGLKRLLAHNLKLRAAQRSLQVIDVLGLGGKRQVAVVRCYDRTFVLGLGEREVSAIAELDPVIGADRPAATPRPADRAAFTQALDRLRTAPEGQPLPQDSVDPRLQAELERRYAEASRRLAEEASPEPTAEVVTEVAPEEAQRPRLVRRKVVRRRSEAADGERARQVASAALEMAETMRRERAGAPGGARTAPTATRAPQAAPERPAAPEEPPSQPRLEGVLG
jgi:flagellar biogenesis protein FliO